MNERSEILNSCGIGGLPPSLPRTEFYFERPWKVSKTSRGGSLVFRRVQTIYRNFRGVRNIFNDFRGVDVFVIKTWGVLTIVASFRGGTCPVHKF